MSFFDWNRDGKKDFMDVFLEYNIYRACMEDGGDDEELLDFEDEFFNKE